MKIITFSPLFIGEVTVTTLQDTDTSLFDVAFSPLFIGEVTVTCSYCAAITEKGYFQSPIHRGSNCN